MSQSGRSRLAPGERKRTFVQVAITLFFRNGVESTTMQQIAREAGVSYGLFYHYFRSKDDLLTEAVDQLSRMGVIGELLADHTQPVEHQLVRLSEVYLELMEEQREIVWLFLSESRKRPALAQRLQGLGKETRGYLCDYLAARQRAGEVRQDLDLEVVARLVYSHLFLRHLWPEPELPPLQAPVDVLLRGLRP
jgi:TetR/AcrR family fatty acid metabolism transcriptional regulator